MIERRHPSPRKGERLIGYHPLPGRPKDAKGALLLVYQFASARGEDGEKPVLTPAESALRHEAEQLIRDQAPLRRGGLKVEQAKLL